MIYLDNNATTQLDPAVVEEMLPFLTTKYGNPSSGYQFGAEARRAINLARERLAALLGCNPEEIIFTSCGTEANNAALNSAVQFEPRGKHMVTTAVEHSAVLRHCQTLDKRGCSLTFVGVDQDGNLDLDELGMSIRSETAIVSVMWANNETGVLFPVEEIAPLCREKRVLFHTDAVQIVGKIPIRLRDTAISSLALSAHKLHGPKGVGALYLNSRTRFAPSIVGGSQENGRRAGTENVASIVGLGKAAECAAQSMAEEETRVRRMRDLFETGLRNAIPGVSINGEKADRLPNTCSVSFAGIDSGAVLILLDRDQICCSAGSACRTGATSASHVLTAMKMDEDHARGTVRFSFGRFNCDSEIDEAISAIVKVVAKLKSAGHRPAISSIR